MTCTSVDSRGYAEKVGRLMAQLGFDVTILWPQCRTGWRRDIPRHEGLLNAEFTVRGKRATGTQFDDVVDALCAGWRLAMPGDPGVLFDADAVRLEPVEYAPALVGGAEPRVCLCPTTSQLSQSVRIGRLANPPYTRLGADVAMYPPEGTGRVLRRAGERMRTCTTLLQHQDRDSLTAGGLRHREKPHIVGTREGSGAKPAKCSRRIDGVS